MTTFQAYSLILLSIIGFGICYYIFNAKHHHKKVHCFLTKECNKVLHDSHSHIFGYDNTVFGMIFYAAVFVTFIQNLLFENIIYDPFVLWATLLISLVAMLYSAYLYIIQKNKLKTYCEYCITTFVLNILIFIMLLTLIN